MLPLGGAAEAGCQGRAGLDPGRGFPLPQPGRRESREVEMRGAAGQGCTEASSRGRGDRSQQAAALRAREHIIAAQLSPQKPSANLPHWSPGSIPAPLEKGLPLPRPEWGCAPALPRPRPSCLVPQSADPHPQPRPGRALRVGSGGGGGAWGTPTLRAGWCAAPGPGPLGGLTCPKRRGRAGRATVGGVVCPS